MILTQGDNDFDDFEYIDDYYVDELNQQKKVVLEEMPGGIYAPVTHTVPAGCVIVDKRNAKLFQMKRYGEIFPDYEEGGIVFNTNFGGFSTLTYRRKNNPDAKTHIPPGVYKVVYYDHEPALKIVDKKDFDKWIDLENSTGINDSVNDVINFFNKSHIWKELNMPPKRGALLYGPPGNGKSLSIIRVGDKLTREREKFLVILIDQNIRDLGALIDLRNALQGYQIMFVMEEITSFTEGDIGSLLNFLDGNFAWEAFTVATTNYPERLPPELVKRPGRFDRLFEVGNPNDNDRKKYLSEYVPDVSEVVIKRTRGFSVSDLKELVLRSKLYEMTLLQVIVEMENTKKIVEKAFPEGGYKEPSFGM